MAEEWSQKAKDKLRAEFLAELESQGLSEYASLADLICHHRGNAQMIGALQGMRIVSLNEHDPQIRISEYTIYPESWDEERVKDVQDAHNFVLHVKDRGHDRWSVQDATGWVLSGNTGQFGPERHPSNRDEAYLGEFRFSREMALRLAKIYVNWFKPVGTDWTLSEYLDYREGRSSAHV